MFDDLLNLRPGGYQGGFVPKGDPVHDKNLMGAKELTPILIFKQTK